MKNNKGITLVALVVIIIVLIILAGISINLLLGDNGLITKAKESKKQQKIAEIKEKISLELSAAETDAIIRNENLEEEQLNDIVSKYGTLQDDKDTILTKDDNYEISLKEIWYGTLSTSGSYSDKKKQLEMLEKELKELQDRYNELEKINSGNSEILDNLRNQITTLENEKKTLEDSLKVEQDKNKNLEEQIEDLNNRKITIPSLNLSGSLYIYTGNSGQENFGGSSNSNTNFKIDCTNFNYLKIGSISGSVTIKLTDKSNTTTSISATTNEIDISNYILIEMSISGSSAIGSAYRHDSSSSYSAKLDNISLY